MGSRVARAPGAARRLRGSTHRTRAPRRRARSQSRQRRNRTDQGADQGGQGLREGGDRRTGGPGHGGCPVHRLGRRTPWRHYRHLRGRSCHDHPRHRERRDGARGSLAAGARLPAAVSRGRRPQAGGPHRGVGGSGAARRPVPGGGALRDGERGRHHGAAPRAPAVRGRARPEDHLDRRPHRIPPSARAPGREGRGGDDPHAVRRVPVLRVRERRRRSHPCGAGPG